MQFDVRHDSTMFNRRIGIETVFFHKDIFIKIKKWVFHMWQQNLFQLLRLESILIFNVFSI